VQQRESEKHVALLKTLRAVRKIQQRVKKVYGFMRRINQRVKLIGKTRVKEGGPPSLSE
jgi:hypothetical protein